MHKYLPPVGLCEALGSVYVILLTCEWDRFLPSTKSHPPAADTDLCLSAVFSCHSSTFGGPDVLVTSGGPKWL